VSQRTTTDQKLNAEPSVGDQVLQRKCDCGRHTVAGGQCPECEKSRSTLQRATGNFDTVDSKGVPESVHEVLRSPGQPLDRDARAFFEPRFGRDFSSVRVHTDAKAAESARAVNALAYTVGENVVFASGRYSKSTTAGQRLIAHELAHVLQQRSTVITLAPASLRVGSISDPGELEADRIADQVMSGPGQSPLQSPAANTANVVQRSVDYDECTPAEETIVLDSHNRAMAMVANAVTKLRTYNGTTPADVKTALDTHFHSSGTGLARWIAFNLDWLRGESDSPTYECEKPQVGTYRGWSMWCVPFTDIELYPLWFSDPDIDTRARTMIHEWVHRYGCNFDLGYEWEQGYTGHGTLRSLLNADPWAHLVYDIR
jgi:uncharacterized protein DUF4157